MEEFRRPECNPNPRDRGGLMDNGWCMVLDNLSKKKIKKIWGYI
jgi:hypothetical protein